MENVSFEIDLRALIGAILVSGFLWIFWQWGQSFVKPRFYFSDINILGPIQGTLTRWTSLPKALTWLSYLSFFLAIIDPHFLIKQFKDKGNNGDFNSPTEGIAIYLVLDHSGSMEEEVLIFRDHVKKVDLLKEVTKRFILGDNKIGLKGRPNDMIGLIAFARGAQVLAPLTLDHSAILSELSSFLPIGQRDQDGTSIGYAIFKTANIIAATKHYSRELIEKGEPAYLIKNTIMILITDGMQDPNPLDKGKRLRNMDIPEAAAYAKEQGIRLYIVNVEPKLAMEEFEPNRHIMQRAAEITGGKFFMVDRSTNLEEIYADIDKLEKSDLPENQWKGLNKDERPDLYHPIYLYPYLVAIGLFFLLASLILESTLFRRVP